MRPDFWEEMSFTARRDPYAYFLGEDLFVCPVIRPRERERTVCLPKGEWVHFWTGGEYTGGGEPLRIPAPLGRLPVFYRKGSPYEELFRRTAAEYVMKEKR